MNKSLVEQNNIFNDLVAYAYGHIYFGNPPDKAPYSSVIQSTCFYLDEDGYKQGYLELLRALLTLPHIRNNWSLRALEDQLSWLMAQLATFKCKQSEDTDQLTIFSFLVEQLLDRISFQFDEQEYVIPVKGLVLSNPITIGHVTFWPLKEKLTEIEKYDKYQTYKDLPEHRTCIASSMISAELYKAAEILRLRVEETLNVLRFLGAVVWYNQPTRHIYIAGIEPERVSYVIATDGKGNFSRIGDTLYYPIDFQIDDFFLMVADGYGINEFSQWMVDPNSTPLQQILLTSIQWFGDATQEVIPLQAFMKYFIAVESLLKKEKERAKIILPKRAAFILDESNFIKRTKEIQSLIDERNTAFHEGHTKYGPPDILACYSHQLARNVINKVRAMMLESHRFSKEKNTGWQTKEELIAWIETQLAKSK